ncbi:hypothetical protein BD626DRAFT_549920 [Schizophyllum amplum]|uniref:choline-phosphate cytidylyltransferase n=1 Tax=Schizophyllum amplum TaxID=97359 RepID=A0A550C5B7_9AGAR|nr:hypothetical protein BD626DRAFT_549920 [Auriculariopsis ampla]
MDSETTPPPTRKPTHTKRPAAKHARPTDSPAYDACAYNHPQTPSAPHRRRQPPPPRRHHLASVLSDSDGVESPTYDGDNHCRETTPRRTRILKCIPSSPSRPAPVHHITEPPVPAVSAAAFNPASLTAEDIQAYVQQAIDGDPVSINGEPPKPRPYRTSPPPQGRPVRIYADGVYDLFHFAHSLQLRCQNSPSPSVHLLVGVCSDALVRKYKAHTVMNHAERLEAVRHCRWVDEVVAEAPWVVDQAFLDKWRIDYVAHDEAPYPAKAEVASDDVYGFVKSQGKFLPTRRTPGVSTSELLERIVAGYRRGEFDAKLGVEFRRSDEVGGGV